MKLEMSDSLIEAEDFFKFKGETFRDYDKKRQHQVVLFYTAVLIHSLSLS